MPVLSILSSHLESGNSQNFIYFFVKATQDFYAKENMNKWMKREPCYLMNEPVPYNFSAQMLTCYLSSWRKRKSVDSQGDRLSGFTRENRKYHYANIWLQFSLKIYITRWLGCWDEMQSTEINEQRTLKILQLNMVMFLDHQMSDHQDSFVFCIYTAL